MEGYDRLACGMVYAATMEEDEMRSLLPLRVAAASMVACCLVAAGCAGPSKLAAPVTITAGAPTAVSYWNEVATATINMPASAAGTPAERLADYATDLATVQIAVYDAVIAIAGAYRPYAVTPSLDTAGASQEAAAAAAAHGVLRGLFPSRSARYQAAYDSFLGTLPDAAARAKGVAIGAEVAARILVLRADDGRSTALPPFAAGTQPGQFRDPRPANRLATYVRPFVITSNAQFRAPGPPPLDSAHYAADLNETRTLGGSTSAVRTAEQLQIARFHTEPPPTFWPRNLRRFAMTDRSIAISRACRRDVRVLRVQVPLHVLAAVQCNCGHGARLDTGRADTQPPRIPRGA